ncbi:mRNA surveillance protein pelota [Candidatus Altiarchaeota archaeon]
MRIEKKDLRHGILRVRCENLDDLWYLGQVIRPADIVKGKTQRRIKDKDDVKSGGGERKTITLTLRVEGAEYNKDSSSLRVSGIIEDGPLDLVGIGAHHTLNIDSESGITMIKEKWSKTDLSRINDACESTLRPKVLIVVLDDGEATLGLVRESCIDYIEFASNVGGKYDMKGRSSRITKFFDEVAELMAGNVASKNVSTIILAGPGFTKKTFRDHVLGKYPDLGRKCVVEDTGSSGRNGVQEVLKRGAVHKALEKVNSVRDSRLVNDVLVSIGNGTGLAAYGLDDVVSAVGSGAVDVLLVSDRFFFDAREKMEGLISSVRASRGSFHIVNHEEDAGRQLESLGGLAALLRYRIE